VEFRKLQKYYSIIKYHSIISKLQKYYNFKHGLTSRSQPDSITYMNPMAVWLTVRANNSQSHHIKNIKINALRYMWWVS
jgi:hypothetical protein